MSYEARDLVRALAVGLGTYLLYDIHPSLYFLLSHLTVGGKNVINL